jgi:hypothetical protein
MSIVWLDDNLPRIAASYRPGVVAHLELGTLNSELPFRHA